jgi:hypothetical protein
MNISNEEKINMAQDTIRMFELHLYRQILTLGEDPDSFDYSKIENIIDPLDIDKYKGVTELISKIEKLKGIIESLS